MKKENIENEIRRLIDFKKIEKLIISFIDENVMEFFSLNEIPEELNSDKCKFKKNVVKYLDSVYEFFSDR